MKRTVYRLLDLALAIALSLAIASISQGRAAEWPNIRDSDTLWPGAKLDNPQCPNVSADELAKIDASLHASAAAPAAPAVAATSAAPAPIAGLLKHADDLVTGSLGGPSAPRTPPTFDQRFQSPFTFEVGTRYWYSIGQNRFAFTNRISPFGNPTSTLDWDRMQGHSGEGFFRIDHQPTHLYVKGLVGGGILRGGDMDDLDFLVDQINFSNTTSQINGNSLAYGIVDLGYSFDVPSAGVRYGAFVGYHYWRERMTASGILCNGTQLNNPSCPAGALIVPFNTGFKHVSQFERTVYFVTLLLIAVAAAVGFIALGLTGILVLLSDVVVGGPAPLIVGAVALLSVTGLWFAVPLVRRSEERPADRQS